jgi:hypothetical protein
MHQEPEAVVTWERVAIFLAGIVLSGVVSWATYGRVAVTEANLGTQASVVALQKDVEELKQEHELMYQHDLDIENQLLAIRRVQIVIATELGVDPSQLPPLVDGTGAGRPQRGVKP